jgi:hypothetical protein
MTILVNDLAGQRGAYWATSDNVIHFGKYSSIDAACDGVADFSFGPGFFYKSPVIQDQTFTPYTGSNCTVPVANRTTVYVTDRLAGYTITVPDEEQALNRWFVQIPLIRIDPCVLHNGEVIKVKVEFLNQNIGRGICSDCPPVCEGTITVAIVCCESSGSCVFPYFASISAPDDSQPFWNGIAIQNTSGADGTALITAHEKDGGVGTFTTDVIPAGGMFVRTLDQIEFTGTLVGGNVPLWIEVSTGFTSMDGFAMMANTATGESMGYLCRKPCVEPR